MISRCSLFVVAALAFGPALAGASISTWPSIPPERLTSLLEANQAPGACCVTVRPISPLLPQVPSLVTIPYRAESSLALVSPLDEPCSRKTLGRDRGWGEDDESLAECYAKLEAYTRSQSRKGADPALTNVFLVMLIKIGGRLVEENFAQASLGMGSYGLAAGTNPPDGRFVLHAPEGKPALPY